MDMETLIQLIINNLSILLLLPALYFLNKLKNMFDSYISTKGKNLADKEDIETLTKIVESVKTEQLKALEDFKLNNQIRYSNTEREKALKKEIYLEAISAIYKMHNSIMTLHDPKVSTETHSNEFRSLSGTIAKTYLVGSPETIESILRFSSKIGGYLADLYISRISLVAMQNSVDTLSDLINQSSKRKDSYLEGLSTLSEDDLSNETVMNSIMKQLNIEDNLVVEYMKDFEPKSIKLQEEVKSLIQKTAKAYNECYPLLVDILIKIRRELGLNINEEKFKQFFLIESNEQNLEKYFDSVEDIIKAHKHEQKETLSCISSDSI